MSPVTLFQVTPHLEVPATINRLPYVEKRAPKHYESDDVQPPEIIGVMREAGAIACEVMHEAGKAVRPGVTTDELDRIVHIYILDHGAYPSALGYRGFPKSCCTSVSEVICHGIPDLRPLEDGDIVKIDVTAFKNGVHGDSCYTSLCGDVDEGSRLLTQRTQEAMSRAIKAVKPGCPTSVIGRVIKSYAKRFDYGVMREYTGHGVYTTFRPGLVILHCNEPRYSTRIRPGMTFTIEPMLTLGSPESGVWKDDWTVVTLDGSRYVQFEQTLVVAETGAEIITVPRS